MAPNARRSAPGRPTAQKIDATPTTAEDTADLCELAELVSRLNVRIARLAARVEHLEADGQRSGDAVGTHVPTEGRDRLARRRLAVMGESSSPVLRYLAGRERVLGGGL